MVVFFTELEPHQVCLRTRCPELCSPNASPSHTNDVLARTHYTCIRHSICSRYCTRHWASSPLCCPTCGLRCIEYNVFSGMMSFLFQASSGLRSWRSSLRVEHWTRIYPCGRADKMASNLIIMVVRLVVMSYTTPRWYALPPSITRRAAEGICSAFNATYIMSMPFAPTTT